MKKTLALLLIIASVSTNTFAQSCLSSVIFDSLNNVILSNQTIQLNLERPSILLNSKTFAPVGLTSSYTAESIPYAPPVTFNSGVQYTFPADDCWGELTSLSFGDPLPPGVPPFSFDFYGNTYLSCVIGANGLISFDPSVQTIGTVTTSNYTFCQWNYSASLPSTSLYMNSIMGPYHDIHFGCGGSMYFQSIGEYPCRKFVISFNQVPLFFCTSSLVTNMIVLYETTNTIEFYMQSKPFCTGWNGGRSILGIQNANATESTVVPGYNSSTPWSATNEAWRIRPVGDLSYFTQWYKRPTSGTDRTMLNSTNGNILACPDSIEGAQYYIIETSIITTNGDSIIISDSCLVRPQNTLHVINITDTICNGNTYNLNGFNESTAGFYTQNLLTTQGYDSIVNLNLTVNKVTTPTNLALDNFETYFELTWEGDAERYVIYRDNDSIASTTHTIYRDSNVVDSLTYCYQVKAVDGECESEIAEICQLYIGLNEIINNNDISIILYPNPTTGKTILETQGLDKAVDVFIYDITGRYLKTYKLEANQNKLDIDLTGFAKGVYQVKVMNQTKKLIVN
ncbi:MAG: T9SS type A sorting domain-containing protein [Bacteroidales bacterium]